MTILGRIFYLSTVVVAAFVGTLLLKSPFVTSLSDCSEYDFPCEDGGCVDSGLWCDAINDCADESDEKYCKKFSLFNNGDSGVLYSQVPLLPTKYHTSTTILPPKTQIKGSYAASFLASLNASKNSIQVIQFSGLQFSDFSEQRNRARNWILYQRKGDYGWGDETPRSITALCLSDQQPIVRNTESDLLMIKQLEIQLSLELARNGTNPMKLTDLALYLNALLVSCKDPRNFYGDKMVSILRDSVNAAQKKSSFVNPSVYLTLCLNNATTYDDTKQLQDIFFNWNATVSKLHMQSLALLATSCIFRKTNYLNASMYDSIKMEFLRNVKLHGFPGNVYEAALLFQALQEMKITVEGLKDFILKQQQVDGSFGDILSTYLVLPILSGRTLMHMNEYCGHRNTSDLIPLEVLKNVKSKKMHVQYSLNYGVPPEVTQTLQMHVGNGTNFLDVMRLAQEINPKYRFKLSENREVPVVYSVGEMPNDLEKGMYWTLYKASGNSTEITGEESWVPYNGDIRKLILTEEDKVLFWYRPV